MPLFDLPTGVVLMSRLGDVSMVELQGGYIARRCPVIIQNRILVPAEEGEFKSAGSHSVGGVS